MLNNHFDINKLPHFPGLHYSACLKKIIMTLDRAYDTLPCSSIFDEVMSRPIFSVFSFAFVSPGTPFDHLKRDKPLLLRSFLVVLNGFAVLHVFFASRLMKSVHFICALLYGLKAATGGSYRK